MRSFAKWYSPVTRSNTSSISGFSTGDARDIGSIVTFACAMSRPFHLKESPSYQPSSTAIYQEPCVVRESFPLCPHLSLGRWMTMPVEFRDARGRKVSASRFFRNVREKAVEHAMTHLEKGTRCREFARRPGNGETCRRVRAPERRNAASDEHERIAGVRA